MTFLYSPFVYWGQDISRLSLRVDLKSVKAPIINLQSNQLHFSTHGIGAKGSNDYGFHFEFFDKVVPQESFYKISDRQIEFNIKKEKSQFWPRLCSTLEKPGWLKVDFDKLPLDDTEEEMEEDIRNNQNFFRDFRDKDFGRRKKSQKYMSPEELRKVYLFLYNLFQFVGYLFILVILLISFAKEGSESMGSSYTSLGRVMRFLNYLRICETLHPLLGYTRGDAKFHFLQFIFRLFMICTMIDGEPRMQTKPVVFYLFFLYSVAEAIRYPYYMLRVFRVNIGLLTWLRYTMWVPLFPATFICEGVILLRNIPYFEETSRFSLSLPNIWNFSFHLPTLIKLYVLLGFFPFMYMTMERMYHERKRIIGSGRKRRFHKTEKEL